MADYNYPNNNDGPGGTPLTFGDRDGLLATDPQKIIKGTQFDPEFLALETSIASKLNVDNPTFTGIMSGGTFENGFINGGTY